MKMRKMMAVALLAAGTAFFLGSCSSKSKDSADTTADTPVFVDEAPQREPAVKDSLAAIFADPKLQSETATDSTYAVTESGLKYMILREGQGKSPKASDEVTVHYQGKLLDGTEFDSSYSRGEPAAFPLNAVIPGWTEGLQLMKEGGKAVFYIPSKLGYGPTGTPGGPIPPNADLIFTVELISVN